MSGSSNTAALRWLSKKKRQLLPTPTAPLNLYERPANAMRKHAALALLIVLLCQTLSYAQSSPSATSPAIDKAKIISNLLQRIDANEALIAELEAREKALTDEIAKADAAHAELTKEHKLALLELGETRATIKHLHAETSDLKAQVTLWRTESERLTKELKASRKREMILLLGHIVRSLIGR